MEGLLVFIVLAVVGVLIAYRVSPAAKLTGRLNEALSPFEQLDGETRSLQQTLKSETESLSNQYVQQIHMRRLRALPLEELKKYAAGMRLQALKDVGIRTIADLQGWNEYRVSQVHGVGPKSAGAIVSSVAAAIAAAKAIPTPHPTPPFSDDSERQLIQALYRQRSFGANISERAAAFSVAVASHQSRRDAILAEITFLKWLWKFGANASIRRSLEEGEALIGALAAGEIQEMRTVLTRSVADCRSICMNRVPIQSIVRDFNENVQFYQSFLTGRLGASASHGPPPSATTPAPSTGFGPSDVVHVEFGRTVPGPSGVTPASHAVLGPALVQTKGPENLFVVSVGSTSAPANEFRLPPPPRPSKDTSDLRWLKKGEAVQIKGAQLSNGFIYVGEGLPEEQNYAINPRLEARPGKSTSANGTGFYSSYSTLSPEQRSEYLNWLGQGASSPVESGFGMLYFYGIERRLLDLIQGRVVDATPDEAELLIGEVHRLSTLFDKSPGSVSHCCTRLADFAAVYGRDTNRAPELAKQRMKTWELPFSIRYGIGWFMKNGMPIPMEWALRWAYLEPTIFLRTPATRCPAEFDASFAAAYRKKYGDGLVIPANKTKLKLNYQPGWPMHLGREISCDLHGISDVAALTGPQQALKAVVEAATAEIDAYSRYIGRNPARAGSLEAYLSLPADLWSPAAREKWAHFLSSVVDPMKPVPLSSLLQELGCTEEYGLAKLPEIAANLNRANVGFEPDVLAGARRPNGSDLVFAFRLASESVIDRSSPEYRQASLIVSLLACVALADGNAGEEETSAAEQMIKSWQHLHSDLQVRLCAQYRLQILSEISFAQVRFRLASFSPEGRAQLARSVCSLAAADGYIAPAEVKLLEQIYRALDLDSKSLYADLHVGGRQAADQQSQAPRDLSTPGAYSVDSQRLAALRKETEEVGALLAEVFADEDSPTARREENVSIPGQESRESDDAILPGLDSKHRKFLDELLRRASWGREELQSLAAQCQIMLDGALERINDAAFDLLGEPLTEGDDPIFVQQNVLEAAE